MMKNFDPRFKDLPDYIIAITKEIWEDRGIDTLTHYYAPDIIVRAPASIVCGNKDVIAATMATLQEFPDRTLLGEDVIWSGNEHDGFLSSHRLLSTATHTGNGVYGNATGAKLRYRILADCHAIANQINDEWIVRDQGAIVRQLGHTPRDYAAATIAREGGAEYATRPFTPEDDKPGPYQGRGNDDEWGQQLADTITRMMNAAFSIIPKAYDRAANLFYAGGVEAFSYEGVDNFWMGLRASFPNATFSIDHMIGRGEDAFMPPRAAVRWSLHGTHDGWGMFGAPTGASVYIMGMTQVEFGPFLGDGHSDDNRATIRREYTLADETAIWKQILLHQG